MDSHSSSEYVAQNSYGKLTRGEVERARIHSFQTSALSRSDIKKYTKFPKQLRGEGTQIVLKLYRLKKGQEKVTGLGAACRCSIHKIKACQNVSANPHEQPRNLPAGHRGIRSHPLESTSATKCFKNAFCNIFLLFYILTLNKKIKGHEFQSVKDNLPIWQSRRPCLHSRKHCSVKKKKEGIKLQQKFLRRNRCIHILYKATATPAGNSTVLLTIQTVVI